MVLLSIFYTNQIHGGIISRLFFIHFVAPCACSSSMAVKILLQIFLYRIWARCIHTSSVVFPSRMPAGPHFVTQPILLSENIPNIWHKSSTKHKEVRPDWNDKNDNASHAPSYHMEGLPMAQVAIFKEIFDPSAKRFRLWIVLFWTKTSQRLTMYYYLATDNIHIVLENDNTVLIKDLKRRL